MRVKNRWEVWNTGIDTSWFVKRYKLKSEALTFAYKQNDNPKNLVRRYHVRDNQRDYEIVKNLKRKRDGKKL